MNHRLKAQREIAKAAKRGGKARKKGHDEHATERGEARDAAKPSAPGTLPERGGAALRAG